MSIRWRYGARGSSKVIRGERMMLVHREAKKENEYVSRTILYISKTFGKFGVCGASSAHRAGVCA